MKRLWAVLSLSAIAAYATAQPFALDSAESSGALNVHWLSGVSAFDPTTVSLLAAGLIALGMARHRIAK